MLGIVFTGGECPPPQVICQELKGKKAYLVAADSGLVLAEAAGVKPDFIVGDMDSLPENRLQAYPPDCIIRHKTDKDYTDTELAMQLVFEKGCNEIWIVGGGGGRMDHLFAIRSLFERPIFPNRWITASNDIYCIDAQSDERKLSMVVEKDALVSVFPLGDAPWEAESNGLKWPLMGLFWERGFFGLSNVAVDGAFSITAQKGRFMVVLDLRRNNGSGNY